MALQGEQRLQEGFWNPRYSGPRPQPKFRRSLSVTAGDKPPIPRPRHQDALPPNPQDQDAPTHRPRSYSFAVPARPPKALMEPVYSEPFDPNQRILDRQRSRTLSVSSASSSSSSLSSTASSSVGPEQFWAQYRRSSASPSLRGLLLSLPSPLPLLPPEPLYSQVYTAPPPQHKPGRRPRPPARPPPPLPKSSVLSEQN